MKKLLLIISLFISANIFAQDKNEYFVKNNGDTVYCDIKDINIYSKGFIKKKKPKNELIYTIPNVLERKIVDLKDINGYKLKKQFYFYKIHLIRYKSTKLYKTDSIFDFYPKETGVYLKGGVSVLNKDDLRFYRVVDIQNPISTMGGGSVNLNAYYVEKDNSGEAKELPSVTGELGNNLDSWNILKEFCKNDSKTVNLIDKYIKQNKRCNDRHIEDVIGQFVGYRFDYAPRLKFKKQGN